MADTKLITIDPDGDVALELLGADGRVHLLASSKALSLASPVFDRMFKSRFREGLETSSSEARVIPLPDDDAEVLTVLCNVVHHRLASVPRCLSVACLEAMAVTADKYDCIAALTHSSIARLQAGLHDYAPSDHVKLLFAAYVLDIPAAFAKISRAIVHGQRGPFTKHQKSNEQDLVAHNLLALLDTRCAELITAVHEAIELPLPPEIFDCGIARQSVVPYLKALSSSGMWPPSTTLQLNSVCAIVGKMWDIDDIALSQCRKTWCSYCSEKSTSFRTCLRDAMSRILDNGFGLCLDCVKREEKRYRKDKCRVRHA